MEVKLKIVTVDDIELIRKWRNSDLIRNVSYNRDIISSEMQKKWFDIAKNNKSQIHWLLNINGLDVGYAAVKNIDLINKRCEFASLYIGEEKFHLNGSGALLEYEIIEYIYSNYPEINKIYCEVLGFNKKVIQLHKRFGFVIEGELNQHFYLNDHFESVVLLALFKDKWSINKHILEKILLR